MIKKIALGLLSISAAATLNAQQTYTGNGGTDFGGAIGGGSLTLQVSGSNLVGTITRGPGNFSDSLVIYFDTQSGGATSLPTSGEIGSPDYGRRSVVNEFGSGISSFPGAFAADYALVLSPNSSHPTDSLYSVFQGANANTIAFVAGANLTNSGSTNASTYTFTIALSQIGIADPSAFSFDFVTTYLDPTGGTGADATFRSNEGLGNSPTNTGFNNTGFTNVNTFAVVPEPSSVALLGGPAILGAWFYIRRRRA